MATKPKVFAKNIIDRDNPNVTITAADNEATNTGANFVDQLRNRNNYTGWATTGSSDTATCTLDIDWVDSREVDSIILVGHNFKNYTIQRWNGSSFEDFATPINPTASTDFVTEHEVPNQNLSRIRITINATQEANADKFLRQLIITRKIEAGQFQGWPNVTRFENVQNRKATPTLSGKNHVRQGLGGFSYVLRMENYNFPEDLKIIENIFFGQFDGVLFWLSGGDSAQFSQTPHGYRPEDIVLVKPVGEYNPTFNRAIYTNGINLTVNLVEAI